MSNASVHTQEKEIQITDSPFIPFNIVHTDHFGPLTESHEGFKHILLIIDAFTRFTWLFAVKSTSSKEAIKHFSSLFHNFGNPKLLISDRGTAFTSHEFLQNKSIKHRLIAVSVPQANGVVERVNKFLKSSFKKLVDENQLELSY